MKFSSVRPASAVLFLIVVQAVSAQTELQQFDDATASQNAGWIFNDEGQNPERGCADCVTDLGWKDTNHAGGDAAGEGGGLLHRSGTLPVGFYGDLSIGELTFDMPIMASGKLALINRDFDGELHFGFFAGSRLQEDPTDLGADIGFIIAEPGGNVAPNFRWGPILRTDGGLGDRNNVSFMNGLPDSQPFDFSIVYDPDGGAGSGLLTLTIADEEPVERALTPEERDDGATLTAFGVHTGPLISSADMRSAEILFDDVAYSSLLSDITPGDFNDDGAIDVADFNILAENFNAQEKSFADGDMNFNGSVDLADFIAFRAVFEATNPAVAAVPEPGSGVLLAFGFLLLARLRSGRQS